MENVKNLPEQLQSDVGRLTEAKAGALEVGEGVICTVEFHIAVVKSKDCLPVFKTSNVLCNIAHRNHLTSTGTGLSFAQFENTRNGSQNG